jgi:mannosyltransferase
MKTSVNVASVSSMSNNHQTLHVLLTGCLLLALAWGLWLWRLDASDLTFDETATYFVAHRPPLEIIQYLQRAIREHPPVYYLLIRCWMALVGTSEFSLRAFSVSAGMIALALTGRLGRLIDPNRERPASSTLIPPALLAVTPGMAFYARDARMYSLGVVWALLAATLFLRDWLRPTAPPRPRAVVALIVVHALALFTHYYLLFPILIQALALLIVRRRRSFAIWCAAHIPPAIFGLIWLALSPGLQMTTDSLIPRFSLRLPTVAQAMWMVDRLLFSPIIFERRNLLYGFLALTAAGLILITWRRRRVGVWMTLMLTLPLPFAYLVPHPPEARFLTYQLPFVALALGNLCQWALSRSPIHTQWIRRVSTWLLASLVAGLLSAGGLRLAVTCERSAYGRTLETVKAHTQPGDRILFYGPWQWIQFHYYDPGDLPPITTLPEQAPPHLDPAEAEPVLERLLSQTERLWVIPAAADAVDPTLFVWRWLDSHAHRVQGEKTYRIYLPPLPAEAPSRESGVSLGERLQLERVAWEAEIVETGQPFRIALYWQAESRLESDVQIDLTLVEETGHPWASTSFNRAPGETVSRGGLMIPWGAPPGEYGIYAKAIDKATGETLAQKSHLLSVTVNTTRPAPAHVLRDLPHADAATFCAPDGAPCIQLAGYEPGGVRFQQGYPAPMTLHWLAPELETPPLDLQLQIAPLPQLPLFGEVEPVVTRTLRLDLAAAQQWSPGRLLTLPTALTLPPDAPTGRARVSLAVRTADGVLWTAGDDPGETRARLFDIIVEGRPVQRKLPPGLTPVEIDLGEAVSLRGYRVQGQPRPGGRLHVTYAWYARAQPTSIYAVFNHLVAPDGAVVTQVDSWPQGGRMLSIQWQTGEYVEDVYTLDIPPEAPPGPYTLYVGLYNAANDVRQPAYWDGQRLPDDRWPVPLPGEKSDE